MKPVKVLGQYVVMFDAQSEDRDAETHFKVDCGWSDEEWEESSLEEYDFFCAEVSIWKDSEQLKAEYLGACCHKNADEFTLGHTDYFGDMVMTCCESINDPVLTRLANEWLRPAVDNGPPVPEGYTREELERDNPYNQWMYEDSL